jgi:hypothetical protein
MAPGLHLYLTYPIANWPWKLASDLAADVGELVIQVGAQGRDRPDDDTGNQSYQQAVFHRARSRLVFEEVSDPFHFSFPSKGFDC